MTPDSADVANDPVGILLTASVLIASFIVAYYLSGFLGLIRITPMGHLALLVAAMTEGFLNYHMYMRSGDKQYRIMCIVWSFVAFVGLMGIFVG
ncbi:MAG TPA: hypothetical protein VLE72_03740 [Candidatus Saccharimonadales bacterium]|nr:hypothetical protein [Candidatus Saccharimonadales bacterium]